jgi:hypothetical protein
MISSSRSQAVSIFFSGDVAMPSNRPGRTEAFDPYQSDSGVGANPKDTPAKQRKNKSRTSGIAAPSTLLRPTVTRDLLKMGQKVTGVPDDAYQAARAAFDERELVDLTIAISVMNAYNRMAISFRNTPHAVRQMVA